MKWKRSKVFLLAVVLVANGLLVIDGGLARPTLAEEYLDTELEIGMKVGEGDKLFAPEWFGNFVSMMICYTDENGRLMDTKFGILNAKSYTIPSYREIWGNMMIPDGKVFDCWEVVKKPEKQTYQMSWELKRVLKDAASEEPKPSEEVRPSEGPKPSEEVKPSKKPGPSNGVKPSEEVKPSKEPGPSNGVKPSEEVKPSKEPGPSNGVKPSEEVKPSKEPGPSNGVQPSEEVKPSKEPGPSNGVKPSETVKVSDEPRSSSEAAPSEAVKPSWAPASSETVKPSKAPDSNWTAKPGQPVHPIGTIGSNMQPIQDSQPDHTFLSRMDTASVQTPALLQTAAARRNQQPADKKTATAAKRQAVPDTVIYAGTYSLEAGATYTLGSSLMLEGDTTEYAQGIQFRVKAGGSFTFH